MATFRPRTTKHGVVYDIQVKVKDFSTQKTVIKTTTWKPEEKMTPKQEERACAQFAEQFEHDMINLYSANKYVNFIYDYLLKNKVYHILSPLHKNG